VLQSEKNTIEILDVMDFQPPQKRKNPNKTHQMGVLESVKNETLESHASVREKRQRQATRLLFVQKIQERSDQFPKFGRVKATSVHLTNYVSKPPIFVQSCPCFG